MTVVSGAVRALIGTLAWWAALASLQIGDYFWAIVFAIAGVVGLATFVARGGDETTFSETVGLYLFRTPRGEVRRSTRAIRRLAALITLLGAIWALGSWMRFGVSGGGPAMMGLGASMIVGSLMASVALGVDTWARFASRPNDSEGHK